MWGASSLRQWSRTRPVCRSLSWWLFLRGEVLERCKHLPATVFPAGKMAFLKALSTRAKHNLRPCGRPAVLLGEVRSATLLAACFSTVLLSRLCPPERSAQARGESWVCEIDEVKPAQPNLPPCGSKRRVYRQRPAKHLHSHGDSLAAVLHLPPASFLCESARLHVKTPLTPPEHFSTILPPPASRLPPPSSHLASVLASFRLPPSAFCLPPSGFHPSSFILHPFPRLRLPPSAFRLFPAFILHPSSFILSLTSAASVSCSRP